MSRLVDFLATQRQLEIRFYLRIEVLIQVHRNRVFAPLQREQMKITLHRIVRRIELAVIRIRAVIERLAPMACAVEIAILNTVLNAVMMSHLADVYLAALGPHHASFFGQFFQPFIHIVVVA